MLGILFNLFFLFNTASFNLANNWPFLKVLHQAVMANQCLSMVEHGRLVKLWFSQHVEVVFQLTYWPLIYLLLGVYTIHFNLNSWDHVSIQNRFLIKNVILGVKDRCVVNSKTRSSRVKTKSKAIKSKSSLSPECFSNANNVIEGLGWTEIIYIESVLIIWHPNNQSIDFRFEVIAA